MSVCSKHAYRSKANDKQLAWTIPGRLADKARPALRGLQEALGLPGEDLDEFSFTLDAGHIELLSGVWDLPRLKSLRHLQLSRCQDLSDEQVKTVLGIYHFKLMS